MCVCVFPERPSEEPGWSQLQLAAVILVPSCLLCVGIVLGVLVVQGRRCVYSRGHKQDPEEPLDDQMLMSPDRCLKDLIYDMSTSGSGSGTSRATDKETSQNLHNRPWAVKTASFFLFYFHTLLLKPPMTFPISQPSAPTGPH